MHFIHLVTMAESRILQVSAVNLKTMGKLIFFKENRGKCVCLICNETVAVLKESNIKLHYETRHINYKGYTGAKRQQKLQQMVASFQAQQQQFFRANKTRKCNDSQL